jgi:hypothetical protein
MSGSQGNRIWGDVATTNNDNCSQINFAVANYHFGLIQKDSTLKQATFPQEEFKKLEKYLGRVKDDITLIDVSINITAGSHPASRRGAVIFQEIINQFSYFLFFMGAQYHVIKIKKLERKMIYTVVYIYIYILFAHIFK